MMRWLPWMILGCADPTVDEAPPCALTSEVVYPEAGAAWFGGGPIEVQLSYDDATASFSGGDTYRRDGGILGLWPDPPLAAGQEASVTLTTCAGASTLSATTSSAGAPLDAGASVVGRSYVVDVATATFLRPAAFGQLIALVPDATTRLFVGMVDATTLRIGVADEAGAQDLCGRTLDVRASQVDGYLVVPDAPATLSIGDVSFDLRALRMTAGLTADAGAIAGGAASLFIGVQGMADLWAEGDITQACTFFGDFSLDCVPCPDVASDSCLVVDAVALAGAAVDGAPVAVTEVCSP